MYAGLAFVLGVNTTVESEIVDTSYTNMFSIKNQVFVHVGVDYRQLYSLNMIVISIPTQLY